MRWDIVAGREDREHMCVISMQAQNKPGSLAQISTVIAACEANIHNLVMRMESPDFHRFIFQIEVRDLAQLTDVLNSLKLATGISDVQRATVAEARALDRLEWTAPANRRGTRVNTEEVLDLFRDSGALLEGHFILSSGLRSPIFLQKARVFMYPEKAEKLCRALADKIRAAGYGDVSQIVSPAVGGIIPGYETARHMGVPAIYTERVNGVFELRRGFEIAPGEKVIVVEDIVSTGVSIRECIEAIRKDRRECGRRRLPDRPLGRRGRGRRPAGLAGRVQSAGLSGRRAATRARGHPGDQAGIAGLQ